MPFCNLLKIKMMKNIIKSEKILHFFFSKMFMIFVVLKVARC